MNIVTSIKSKADMQIRLSASQIILPVKKLPKSLDLTAGFLKNKYSALKKHARKVRNEW